MGPILLRQFRGVAPGVRRRMTPPTEVLGRLVEAGARGAERSDRAFEAGLELLLDGLRLRLARYEND